MSIEESIYEIDELWKPENIKDSDVKRITFLADVLPNDIDSLVDIGCGGGIFINYIKNKKKYKRIVGVDRSLSALKYVQTENISADITNLPFVNNEFDVVTCLEVLEHIPFFNYSKALNEIARISKKYILISVPYNQDLKKTFCKCPICLTEFNPSFHVRSFNKDNISSLFNKYGFSCISTYNVLSTSSYLGKSWMEDPFGKKKKNMPWSAICPVCGFHKEQKIPKKMDSNIYIADNIITKTLKRIWPKKNGFKWLAALYIKRD